MMKGIYCSAVFLFGLFLLAITTTGFCLSSATRVLPLARDFAVYSTDAADLEDDGEEEIAAGCFDRYVRVITKDGRILWSYRCDGLPYKLTIADVDGDGIKEIVAVVMGKKGSLILLKYGKGKVWEYHEDLPFLSVAVGDLDGDNNPEVIAGSFLGKIYVFSGSGKLNRTFQLDEENLITALTLGDLDGKRGEELIVGTTLNGVIAMDGNGRELWQVRAKDVRTERSHEGRKRKRKKTYHPHDKLEKVRTVQVVDLDEDGSKEVIVGGRPCAMILALNHDGSCRWQKNFPDLMDWTSSALAVAGNFSASPGKEIFAITNGTGMSGLRGAGPTVMLNATGALEYFGVASTQFFSLTLLSAPSDRYGRVVLTSGTRGKGLNVVSFGNGGKDELSGYRDALQEDIEDRLIHMGKDGNALSKKRSSRQFHFLFRANYKDLYGQNKARVDAFLAPLRRVPGDNAVVVTGLREGMRVRLPGGKKQSSRREILDVARWLEKNEIPFFLNIGKHVKLFFRVDTLGEILDVAKKTCRGFIIDEDNYTRTKQWRKLTVKLNRLLDIMAAYDGKKLVMNEYRDFWHRYFLVEENFDRLLQPKYRETIVPIYKPNNIKAPELNMGALAGMWQKGIISDWGVGAYADIWKWGPTFISAPGDIHLRLMLMAASLGANYFVIAKNLCWLEDALDLAPDYKPYFETLFRLVDDGIISPVENAQDVLLPGVFRWEIAEPREVSLRATGTQIYWQMIFQMTGWHDTGFFLQRMRDDYLSGRVYGGENYYDMLFPVNLYGLVPLVPYVAMTKSGVSDDDWVVKGDKLYFARGNGLRIVESSSQLVDKLKGRFRGLAFSSSSVYSMTVKAPYGYLVYLINPCVFQCEEIKTSLNVNMGARKMVFSDATSGKVLTVKDGKIDVIVPPGLFRLITVTDMKNHKKVSRNP